MGLRGLVRVTGALIKAIVGAVEVSGETGFECFPGGRIPAQSERGTAVCGPAKSDRWRKRRMTWCD